MAKPQKKVEVVAQVEATSTTYVARCGKAKCDSPYQDSKYGSDMRVFNKLKEGKGGRCTCCGEKQ